MVAGQEPIALSVRSGIWLAGDTGVAGGLSQE